jgi:hypothetical protein
MMTDFSKQPKTISKDIFRVFPSLKSVARWIRDEISSFFRIIDLAMVYDIVKYINVCIQSKHAAVKFLRNHDAKDMSQRGNHGCIEATLSYGDQKGILHNHLRILELRAHMSIKRF